MVEVGPRARAAAHRRPFQKGELLEEPVAGRLVLAHRRQSRRKISPIDQPAAPESVLPLDTDDRGRPRMAPRKARAGAPLDLIGSRAVPHLCRHRDDPRSAARTASVRGRRHGICSRDVPDRIARTSAGD